MKVLFLLRQEMGGMASYANYLATGLRELDIQADLIQAEDVIPAQTGGNIDKDVATWLRDAGKDYDLIHAIGLRSAWACATTYSDKEAWLYSVYDMPKSTNRLLINLLNTSQAGLCSSRAVFRMLDEALGMELEIVPPGVPPFDESLTRLNSKKRFGWEPSDFVVGVKISNLSDDDIRLVAETIETLWESKPETKWAVVNDEAINDHELATFQDERVQWLVKPDKFQELLVSLDLWIVASRSAGFSLTTVEAMSLGTPVMLRDAAGLREIVDNDISGFLFRDDDELKTMLVEVAALPLTLESVSHASKIRAMDQFSVGKMAERVAHIYERILGEQ